MSVLRGGIAGCGFFAQFHIDAWRRMDGVELIAACDPDLERAKQAAPHAYASFEQMLASERLDFVDIATRPDTHLPLVRMACEARIPAICQKPMARDWAESVELAAVAERTGVPVMIHENWRWQPWYREAKRRIDGGAIGGIVTYRFRIRQRDGHGPEPYKAQPYFRTMERLLIYETMVHPIDTARFLFGEIESIYAHTQRRNPVIAAEDCAFLLLHHASGITGEADGHRFTDLAPASPVLGDASFEGEQGVVEVTAAGDVIECGRVVWRNEVKTGYRGDSVKATQEHFAACLRRGVEFESSARRYLKTCAAVESAYVSAREGRVAVTARQFETVANTIRP